MMMHRAEAAASVAADDILGGYMFGGDTASNEIGAMITAEADAAWTAADYDYPSRIKFWTQSDGTGNQFAAANAERMVIDSSGNVGIGDTTPSYKLDVNGTFRTTGAATFDGSVTATTFTGNVSGNAATVTTNANLTGHITSSGNAASLGSFTVAQLSTALSDATLSGNNTGDQTNITGNAATVTTNANLTGDVTSSGNATTIAADAVTGAKIADDAIDSEHYADGSIDTAHIAADAVTGAKIADDAVDIAMLSATGTADATTFLRGDNTWTAVSGGSISAVTNGADNRLATFSSSDALNGEAGLLFDGTNLGIGATPNSYTNYTALTVNGVNAGGSLLDMEVNSVLTYELAVEAAQVTHNAVTNVPMVFKQNNTERMRIDATGVGIGTTAPATTLELASTDPVIRLNDSGAISEISGDGGNLAIGAGTVSSSDKVLTLSVQGVERMRINPGGNIQTPISDSYDVIGGSFTYNIDFSDTNLIRLNLTDDGVTGPTSDLTLTTSNREAGRTKRIYIKGMDAAMLTEITEPGWAIFGVDMTSLSSYDMILDMTCWGDDDADITVQAVEQSYV
jgi:hypothetical protein